MMMMMMMRLFECCYLKRLLKKITAKNHQPVPQLTVGEKEVGAADRVRFRNLLPTVAQETRGTTHTK